MAAREALTAGARSVLVLDLDLLQTRQGLRVEWYIVLLILVEIGPEELPPKSLLLLSAAFADGIAKGLAEAGLTHKGIEHYATPRRLAVRVRRLIERQPDRPLERRGPPLKAAFDAQGAPRRRRSRSRRSAASRSACSSLWKRKGAWLVYRGTEAGAPTAELLPAVVQGSSMRCPSPGGCAGATAMHSSCARLLVLMLFGQDIVDTAILGARASNVTYGHRSVPKALPLRAQLHT
jgi:glycyl-tRNA synthetase beta chain